MNVRKRSRNPKRRLHPSPDEAGLEDLAARVSYGGHPHHKRSPGDFGLTPPAAPRPNKSLCDGVGLFQREVATRYLVDGISRGMISRDADQGFPRHVWSITNEGRVLEARCDDPAAGRYHGYPLEAEDPMAELVIKRWKQRSDDVDSV